MVNRPANKLFLSPDGLDGEGYLSGGSVQQPSLVPKLSSVRLNDCSIAGS